MAWKPFKKEIFKRVNAHYSELGNCVVPFVEKQRGPKIEPFKMNKSTSASVLIITGAPNNKGRLVLENVNILKDTVREIKERVWREGLSNGKMPANQFLFHVLNTMLIYNGNPLENQQVKKRERGEKNNNKKREPVVVICHSSGATPANTLHTQ
ncbi:hypothetical protein RFI_31016 [Reticulomyxa filosa]|uniref:Uncharacterized protein n=1 Tax=Reticulomyxa filosa TaxID=46433 RepID=X6LYI0_RETFI|nr:hypothetical protein RFI_31016 [Reticulomyxa filosa]|eukprot:ETO06381.1 hypothetical protein RFI_31016 [Reticulomyxa filosa]